MTNYLTNLFHSGFFQASARNTSVMTPMHICIHYIKGAVVDVNTAIGFYFNEPSRQGGRQTTSLCDCVLIWWLRKIPLAIIWSFSFPFCAASCFKLLMLLRLDLSYTKSIQVTNSAFTILLTYIYFIWQTSS